jgi:hypothetical protein
MAIRGAMDSVMMKNPVTAGVPGARQSRVAPGSAETMSARMTGSRTRMALMLPLLASLAGCSTWSGLGLGNMFGGDKEE